MVTLEPFSGAMLSLGRFAARNLTDANFLLFMKTLFSWTIKDIVNNTLEYYYPLTFPSIEKKVPKKRFILDFFSGVILSG